MNFNPNAYMKNYTDQMVALAQELGVDVSVAMDIDYLRRLEARVLNIAKREPNFRGCENIYNAPFEVELEGLENK